MTHSLVAVLIWESKKRYESLSEHTDRLGLQQTSVLFTNEAQLANCRHPGQVTVDLVFPANICGFAGHEVSGLKAERFFFLQMCRSLSTRLPRRFLFAPGNGPR